MAEKTNASTVVQSLERALVIVDILSTNADGLSIKELSEQTELHKSTVYRLLQTLRAHNYVYQDYRTERYHLGAKILELSANMIERYDIRSLARPVLENLCNTIGETVHLSILDGCDSVYIDKIENENRVIRMYSQIGKRIPVFCSSTGKVLVAWADEPERQRILDNIQFKRRTPNTIVDMDSYLKNLEEVRAHGYAVDWFEHEDSIFCIASPVFDREKNVVAAISVSATAWDLSVSLYSTMRQQVWLAAQLVSKYLGCANYPIHFSPSCDEIQRIEEMLAK